MKEHLGSNISSYEIQVLRMLNGDIPWESGAWVNACFEFLGNEGLCSRTVPYVITTKGIAWLEEEDKDDGKSLPT